MPRAHPDMIAFNRGIVSSLALARTDVAGIQLSAETMVNWLPKTLGPMRLRPGTRYLGSSRGNASAAWLEFVAATDQTALIELTEGRMRVWLDDALLTRPAVATSVSNGSFATSSGWTDASADGASLAFGGSGLVLNAAPVGSRARCTGTIAVSGPDQGVEHGLSVHVTRGPVTFRAGSSVGADDHVRETTLRTGRHSLAVTPTGDIHVTFMSSAGVDRVVGSIGIEAGGTVELAAPWAAADLADVRYDQSADVMFVAATGVRQQRIERRGTGRSWSVVDYLSDAGPFLSGRSADVEMKPAARSGNTTVTASGDFFSEGHVGGLIRIFHSGQDTEAVLAKDGAWSDPWEVTGIDDGDERTFTVTRSGTWSGTLTLQRSYDGPDSGWNDTSTTYTANGSSDHANDDDNVRLWFRVGFKEGEFSSGSVDVSIAYGGGGRTGIARITGRNSATNVDVEVLRPFSDTSFSTNWQEGWWSAARGWPGAVDIFEGRLWWFGGTQLFASVSDDYHNFDDTTEGDAGPIVRSIGRGPVDRVRFALPLLRQVIGTAGSELTVRSSSFDQPLTPSNNSAKAISTQGAANVRALAIDTRGVYVQRSGERLFVLEYDPSAGDYQSIDLTLMAPEVLGSGVVGIAVQRHPETRVHCVLGDGRVAILTLHPAEEVTAWSLFETDGAVEAAAVLPGAPEDAVYYHVRRTIDGATVRYLERWADERTCNFSTYVHDGAGVSALTGLPFRDGTVVTVRDAAGTKVENLTVAGGAVALSAAASFAALTPAACGLADCHAAYAGAATEAISGLSHLEGAEAVVWADGRDRSVDNAEGVQTTHTVAAGQIVLDEAVEQAVAGLPYAARYVSGKLAYGAASGTALTQAKRVHRIGFLLADTHNNGLRFGTSAEALDSLPRGIVYDGRAIDPDDDPTVFAHFDQVSMALPGDWGADPRLHLTARAPRPVTVMAAVPAITTNERA